VSFGHLTRRVAELAFDKHCDRSARSNGAPMPLLEIYKDNEISASAVQSDAGDWTPQVTVTEMRLKMNVTVPNITKAFPTRQEAEKQGLLFAKDWIDQGKPAP
jgi:hypothetical protein